MPSQTRNTRESQRATLEADAQRHRAALKEKGFTEEKIRRDATMRKLLAKIRQIRRALGAIQASVLKNEELAKRKKEKAEQKAAQKAAPVTEKPAKKGKSKGKAEAPSADSGKKAKKEKKAQKQEGAAAE